MSDTTVSLRRKIEAAGELQSVVRSMKALAAASIGQYERSVLALADYYRTVELGLGACLRQSPPAEAAVPPPRRRSGADVDVVVFGSDQGLVGQFNQVVAEYAVAQLEAAGVAPSPGLRVWAVGERVQGCLQDLGLQVAGSFAVPGSVEAITALVGQVLVRTGAHTRGGEAVELHLFYQQVGRNGSGTGSGEGARTGSREGTSHEPVGQRLLPLDSLWERRLGDLAWPTPRLPQVLGGSTATLRALVREYLFVSIFRACAQSLASENASRLAAMQRADKNIDELLETLNGTYHRLRQRGIDEELFDVISGFEALSQQAGSQH